MKIQTDDRPESLPIAEAIRGTASSEPLMDGLLWIGKMATETSGETSQQCPRWDSNPHGCYPIGS